MCNAVQCKNAPGLFIRSSSFPPSPFLCLHRGIITCSTVNNGVRYWCCWFTCSIVTSRFSLCVLDFKWTLNSATLPNTKWPPCLSTSWQAYASVWLGQNLQRSPKQVIIIVKFNSTPWVSFLEVAGLSFLQYSLLYFRCILDWLIGIVSCSACVFHRPEKFPSVGFSFSRHRQSVLPRLTRPAWLPRKKSSRVMFTILFSRFLTHQSIRLSVSLKHLHCIS